MPIRSAFRRHLSVRAMRLFTSHRRAPEADRWLGIVLAVIAGSLNAGVFLMMSQYASHMTGHLSQLAGSLVGANLSLVLLSFCVLFLFVAGAALASAMIARGFARHSRLTYYMPLALQGILLAVLATAEFLPQPWEGHLGLGLLAFIMGLQNATITRISGARIRTTHATGLLTDMGIEIGRGLYGRGRDSGDDGYDHARLMLFVQLVAAFVLGGIMGGLGHGAFGWAFAFLPAVVLLGISALTAPRALRAVGQGAA
ncbi:YoaK family protein [Thioclava litoralis]|uniref:YoaK family protein n=1 Tax=Thioclava litoralis TaxID=3076557 RepID=A0ABZ1DXX9_9RHOB|nr:YoaK family protein [Thioclava sp. FTW29]